MITMVVLAGGSLILVLFAVVIGMSVDTETRRRGWKRVAEQRRLMREQCGASRTQLCANCPLRRPS